jgi:hypothetical protein
MRKTLFIALSAAGLLLLTGTTNTRADDAKTDAKTDAKADAKTDAKTVTVTGEGKCAKCSLKETDSCQNVIQTKEGGKTVTYYVTKNDVANKFHKTVCQGSKQVTAKGTVKEVNGKKELTVTEIKVASAE